ncbi:MAG: serine protease [Hyphomonas sp.]
MLIILCLGIAVLAVGSLFQLMPAPETSSPPVASRDETDRHALRNPSAEQSVSFEQQLYQELQDALDTDAEPAEEAIVDGHEADPENWPGIVSLQSVLGSTTTHECGGTLISRDWVLTAAHCVEGVEVEATGRAAFFDVSDGKRGARMGTAAAAIGLGRLNDIPKGAVFPISQVIIHPEYKSGYPQLGNDIALLRLASPSNAPQMLMEGLSARKVEYGSGEELHIAGYGLIGENAQGEKGLTIGGRHISAPSLILLEGQVPKVETQACRSMMRTQLAENGYDPTALIVNRATQMCAGAGSTDTCYGDSGGPMTLRQSSGKPVQVGIVSWGVGCGRENSPGVYTRVAGYADWIKAATGITAP